MSRKILFFTGSPTDTFHANLSRVYASDCLEALAKLPSHDFRIAWFFPDGTVCFPDGLQESAIAVATRFSLVEALQEIDCQDFDAAVPQMFCPAGMTDYRSLIETIGVPLVGNTSTSMAITMDKAKSRAIAATANIPIPKGIVVGDSDAPRFSDPVVVKPARADNSHGVSLVTHRDDFDTAITAARKFDAKVVIEQFIPAGREVRCATLFRNGRIECLPLQEYDLSVGRQAIRDEASKLTQSEDGSLDLTSKHRSTSWILDAGDPITDSVWSIARQCHHVFECRDYGLFDFRIDPSGRPYFLEAGLYCSFAPKSIVVAVADAAGISLDELFIHCVDLAINRDRRGRRHADCLAGPSYGLS